MRIKRLPWCFALVLSSLASNTVLSQQTSTGPTPEEIAFSVVRNASNAAARMAAAEDFVVHFPQSSKRSTVARLVAEHLYTLRNPAVALTLVERARLIFSSPSELESLSPAALKVYIAAGRSDDAYALAANLLSMRPDEFWVLCEMTSLGANEARNRNLKHLETSLRYGVRAIELIEKDQRPASMTEATWSAQKMKLPDLYQQSGIMTWAMGNFVSATDLIHKAIELKPKDPSNFALLGRMLHSAYLKRFDEYQRLADSPEKKAEHQRIESLLDEIINSYACAASLATGRTEYSSLMQQVIPDLTNLYKYMHNQSTEGLRQLITSCNK